MSRSLYHGADRDNGSLPTSVTRTRDIDMELPLIAWERTVYCSRRLWANFGPARAMTIEKAMWATGRAWLPVFLGGDKSWGNDAHS